MELERRQTNSITNGEKNMSSVPDFAREKVKEKGGKVRRGKKGCIKTMRLISKQVKVGQYINCALVARNGKTNNQRGTDQRKLCRQLRVEKNEGKNSNGQRGEMMSG